MIRELLIAAAITGTAVAVAPAAAADPHYDGDVPGMNYDASLGAPCDNYERFTFGRGPDGTAEACHFITHQNPHAESGYCCCPSRCMGYISPVNRALITRICGGRPRSLPTGFR